MGLKHLFEKIEPHFTEGKLKKYYPLFEATTTILHAGSGNERRGARSRRHRSQANDDSGLVCGLPGHVLGDV